MIKSLGVFTLLCLLVVSSSAVAEEKVTVNVHASSAQLLAHELVYSGSEKVSELIWDTKSASLLGVDVHWSLNPEGSVHANLSCATTISKASSVMDDYDWLVVGADWSHWSHHENTNLEQGSIFDINLAKAVYASAKHHLSADFLLGYRQDKWRWQSVGGTYTYTTTTFRDTQGTFPDIPVINYEQIMDTPYIGIDGRWYSGDLIVGVKLVASAMVSATAVDHHYLRDLVFKDTFKNGNMYGADVNVAYALSANSSVSLNYHTQTYSHNRGDTRVDDQITGASAYAIDVAGMSLDYNAIGIAYSREF